MDVFSLASVAVVMIRRVRRTDVIPTANSAIFSQPQISKATDPRSKIPAVLHFQILMCFSKETCC